MADQKITELTQDTAPALTDLVATVEDPSGTPATKKVTFTDVFELLTSNLIGCSVTMSTDQTNIGTSYVKVNFDTESYDTGSAYDTTNKKFTVPAGKAGYYYIQNRIYFYETITDASQYKAGIYLNGALIDENTIASSGTNVGITCTVQIIVHLAVGDYVEFYAASPASANTDIYSATTHSKAIVQQIIQDQQ